MTATITRRRLIGKGAGLAAALPLAGLPTFTSATPAGLSIPPRWDREPDLTSDGDEYDEDLILAGGELHSGMFEIASELCHHWGWLNDTASDGSCRVGSADDRYRVFLQPIPLAVVFHELCYGFCYPVPDDVQRAFESLRPQVFPGQEG